MTTNVQQTVGVLVEFFEVVINNILYVRKLYPDAIFEPRKKYGIVVYQIVHPGVKDYIRDCLKAIEFHCKRKQLQRFFVCFESDDKVIDKFAFDILNISEVPDFDPFFVELEQRFRNFILILHTSKIYLSDLSANATFSIRLQTTFSSSVEFNEEPMFEDFPWVEENKTENTAEQGSSVIPLHTMNMQNINIQIFIEK